MPNSWLAALTPSQRIRLSTARDWTVETLGRYLAAVARVCPDRLVVALRKSLQPVRKMDYPRAAIHIYVDSEQDRRVRLRASQKEPETVAWIESYMASGDILFDIGANVGTYSLIASKYTRDRMKIFAFEPSFANLFQLNRNIILNKCQGVIIPVPVALWRESGLFSFGYDSIETGSAFHSLRPEGTANDDAAYLQQMITYRLDDLVCSLSLPLPNHLKLDVDGEELEILRGAKGLLGSPSLRSVLVEVYEKTADDITTLLTERGLELQSKHWHGGVRAWNFIFVRSSRKRPEYNASGASLPSVEGHENKFRERHPSGSTLGPSALGATR